MDEPVDETMTVAVLDDAGRFLRCDTIAPEAFDAAAHVHPDDFGGACDLPPGQYVWNRERKTFESAVLLMANERLAALRRAFIIHGD